jgi:hypothetical protein
MGTNYYLHSDPKVCPTCGHDSGPEPLHIGKSSGGWCFSLHVEPGQPDHPQSLEDWIAAWSAPGAHIRNEYGEGIEPERMLSTITERKWSRDGLPHGYESWDEFHRRNGSVAGPNGLIRSRPDGLHCVGHGPGTWDLIAGEFS